MNLRFRIHYHTSYGQSLFVSGSCDALGMSDPDKAVSMTFLADGLWELKVEVPDTLEVLSYQYWLGSSDGGQKEQEYPFTRHIQFSPSTFQTIEIRDEWFSSWEEQTSLLSSAFSKALMKRTDPNKKKRPLSGSHHRFQLLAPDVQPGHGLFLAGNSDALGNWDPTNSIPLSGEHAPVWSASIPLKGKTVSVEYKYLIKDLETGEVVRWETG
ncbi:MAG: carbohydrate-binding module family 20 domain-containing protein, partial [Bacteroidota bacterium]